MSPASETVRRALSVVIPAYNEAKRLPNTLLEVDAFLRRQGYDSEIIVVDDGSRDGTLDRVRELAGSIPSIRVLTYGGNRGKGFAVKTGVLAASREAVLFTDADLSTPIADVERLWTFYDRGADVVIASRRHVSSEILVRQPWRRRLIGQVFSLIVSTLGVRGFKDTQCGFKLFRAGTTRPIFPALKTDGFAFDVEILMRARGLGLRIAEVPVRWTDSPDSRVHPVRDSWRMFLELLRMRGLI